MTANNITVVGNLTRDPELRYSTGGVAITNFGLAVNRRYQRNGEWVEETSFFNAVAFGDQAENIAQTLVKGTRALLCGRLQQRNYETNEGENRSVVEIIIDEAGPSLRWATAEVEKVERDKPSSGSTNANDSTPPLPDEEPF